jgi:hypothetical protein
MIGFWSIRRLILNVQALRHFSRKGDREKALNSLSGFHCNQPFQICLALLTPQACGAASLMARCATPDVGHPIYDVYVFLTPIHYNPWPCRWNLHFSKYQWFILQTSISAGSHVNLRRSHPNLGLRVICISPELDHSLPPR